MDSQSLRDMFGVLAEQGGYSKLKSSWFRVNPETVIALDLQKSSYSSLHYLNIRVWIKGFWTRTRDIEELLVESGDIFRREPPEFSQALDLENSMDPAGRQAMIEQLFRTFLTPLTELTASLTGIRRAQDAGLVHLLPVIRKHLDI
jgi:hypothetical protein